ncbi:Choline transporter-like protein 3 [Apodemus speciosus]|uniref:Choline transporter-like protein n=1 Tax=Apodemus speciosus TaxID=105296 RepID=A0ABQ0ELX9_APOSI
MHRYGVASLVLSLLDWFEVFIMGYSVVAGAAGRLLFGYDSFGNVCGKRNSPVEGAPLSGQDMTLKKHVFFMNACDLDVKDKGLGPTALCVSSCPEKQLDTLEEVQLFANINGSFLKPFPLFNRCIPQTPECYSLFASVWINDADAFHRILSGIMAGKDTILGLCVFTFAPPRPLLAWGFMRSASFPALSLAMLFTFRFISNLLVHIIISLVILGLVFVCGVLWWLYYDYTNDLSTELDTEKENMKCMLAFAIIATVVTVVLLALIFTLRKRIKLTVDLLRVTNKAISSCPFLLFQPLWTFVILIFFWVLWVAVLLSLGTAGTAQVLENGQVEYKPLSGIRYMWWYHLIGLVWTSEFILACQRITVAGAMVACYFNRDAYTAAAINGTDFCTSAKDAHTIIAKHSSHLMSVNCFGNFVIFLGKISFQRGPPVNKILVTSCDLGNTIYGALVVSFSVFGGLMAFNYNRALQVWAIPLLLVAFFACVLAHSFLSVFETALDILFLCFAVDLETNDGSPEKPYFMDPEFLSFVKRTNNFNNDGSQGHKASLPNEEGTELRPIVR